MRILILGGTGAMGKPLVQYLSENKENSIYVVSRKERTSRESNVHYICGNAFKDAFFHEIMRKRYDVIVVKKQGEAEQLPENFQVLISGEGKYNIPSREEIFEIFLENICEKNKKSVNLEQKTYTKWFDYGKIENDLVIRTRRSGDYFIVDDKGHRQTLKSFFINEKIPREQRDKILLLADGSHIVWIIGYRISFQYKIENNTKRVLKIQMDGGNESE